MVYMVTYDLNNPGQNYENVIETIKQCASMWCTFWKSSYLIKSTMSANEIANKLDPYLDKNDRAIVIEVKSNYQGWLAEDEWDYIRKMFS